ncbi:thiol-disulfide oxidoreductase ResA [Alkalicoccobacillus porphyridii]|uniref:Thiol-disulfide oxidoreductase ResA n=1 Tax=Alkalicoccobacillus porphyridii TaxID=2597270 RepID=A0A553ZZJ3_9BACI|nr:thiol-disulfide oxidoreductase ResA [Alkalicoccobacillus porphyridii]TSB46864.1 thiol-disulfide oxidoreductase ResA [Alkalicoccobacillus porphyridii]
MKRKRLIMRTVILLAILIAVGYAFYSNFIADHSIAQAGNASIDFSLEDLQGEPHQLSNYEGKGVMLNFWGTFCPPCEREMPHMEALYEEYKDKGVEILAVNVNEAPLTVNTFVNRYGLSFPILLDKGMNVTDAYGVRPLPTTILINESGMITKVHEGGMTEEMVEEFLDSIVPQE